MGTAGAAGLPTSRLKTPDGKRVARCKSVSAVLSMIAEKAEFLIRGLAGEAESAKEMIAFAIS
jgi:hypothetical protein